MKKPLIIVESPTKIKTLKKFLGNKYSYASSVGHIRDLPKKGFGIDFDNDFEPQYETLEEKKEVIQELKKTAKAADVVYLAPDPDREGEAIAWHIAAILPKGTKMLRISFNSYTKSAVEEALKTPREIDNSLVDAQQARRLLDRIVGYKISPILTRKVKKSRDGGLSAGRVQSVALKLVVDREREIDAFNPVEYWNIAAHLETLKKDPPFTATLYSVEGKRVDREPNPKKNIISISDEKTARSITDKLKGANYSIASIDKKEKKRNPVPSFITSTLQQEASRHYGYSAARTMNIAQGLYEGVDLGKEGTEGLITYMRTDSVRVAPEALAAARDHIKKEYGANYLPEKPIFYASKKASQDAHEAIRPTNLAHPPERVKPFLSIEQYKLYLLVWRRFIASQMLPAIYDTISCDIATNQDIVLRATGSTIKFRGFLAAYEEKSDTSEEEKSQAKTDKILPKLAKGDKLNLLEALSDQAFTRPPPRFTEASLVKELEKHGIGRPSTYASIMNKIQSRDYTIKEKGSLRPTELGKVIAKLLEDNFSMIMDVGFTAAMEDDLDSIAEEHRDWKELIRLFWDHFIPTVEAAAEGAFVPKELTDIDCPQCGKKLEKIWSRQKWFFGCQDYPTCKYTTSEEALNFNKEDYNADFDWEQPCPKCKGPLKLRFGRFGPFLGCAKYPECKGIVNIPRKDEALPEDMPTCPAIGCDGKITQRRSRFGKPFFSCSNYPDCNVIANSIEQLEEKYRDHPKTPYVKKTKKGDASKRTTSKKKTTKKKTTTRKQKAYKLSKELQAVTGAPELSRPEVTKALWVYIKKHNLQDPKNKRLIVPDAKLTAVFGSPKPLDMMKLAGMLKNHLT